jgi:hypothetical protein
VRDAFGEVIKKSRRRTGKKNGKCIPQSAIYKYNPHGVVVVGNHVATKRANAFPPVYFLIPNAYRAYVVHLVFHTRSRRQFQTGI